ncbi:DUF167 domain-containing protein [Coraliomargarita sp. SDUM461003]|uniref:UPF0235 protein QEH52_06135 n=1 Tax=Thalassobacterium maritimum TaxID=3041265 RepID=A0ABU1ASQ0_9BACT|nr:DUF167 domain-containing protein [Coraliomargarita sp. SDUM461003]MBT62468.1 hypothetical protein [Puniceicoccaceae bacterium]MDQ8207078.1 DUF167 domain-containing protein [Coraliomargarita sp. SDUM461003]HBR94120.1 hypothetical protein [Opitutae bacterium]|tara:strand:- start:204 stop:446 length:243 start_codon:yes stop_codon:yes gene_type:complete
MKEETLQIKVKPNAKTSALEAQEDGTWKASIKSPPVDGKANKELIALISKTFKCPKRAISIKVGTTGRMKLVKIKRSELA